MLLRLREKALGGDARALDRLIGLAQVYNNEELTAASGLSAYDAKLLELFKQRVLSGLRVDPADDERARVPRKNRSGANNDQAGPRLKKD